MAWRTLTLTLTLAALSGGPAHPPARRCEATTPQADRRAVVRVRALRIDAGQVGRGSAVVLRADGILVTAAHAVEAADVLTVELSDGRQLAAELLAIDAAADLALLRIHVGGLPMIRPAATSPAVGDVVQAIGSATVGGRGRVIGAEDLADVGREIYTSAAFGPGDSGGALLNDRGELAAVLLGEAEAGLAAIDVAAVGRLLARLP